MELIVHQHPQPTLLPGMVLRPPGPEGDRRDQDQEANGRNPPPTGPPGPVEGTGCHGSKEATPHPRVTPHASAGSGNSFALWEVRNRSQRPNTSAITSAVRLSSRAIRLATSTVDTQLAAPATPPGVV